jgi:hypothetical protein
MKKQLSKPNKTSTRTNTTQQKTYKSRAASLLNRLKQTRRSAKAWLAALGKWQRRFFFFGLAIATLLFIHVTVESLWRPYPTPNYGMSFSIKYAEELGLDWQETLTALLDDIQIKNYRLMSYWDTIESERGVYTFDDLDWQMDQVAKRNGTVSLGLGLRQPRWPECHQPGWYNGLTENEQDEALLDFVGVVVDRYKDHPALISYQLENEAVNSWFGTCTKGDINRDRLVREFELVKSLDPIHPVWMSLSDQHGLPLNEPVPDKYGYSVYRTVWNDKTPPFTFYLTYPTPVWYHKARMAFINTYQDREVFIHELQLEPWAPKATVNVSVEEQDKSMDLEQMEENVDFARKIGVQDIYVWGGEWWYWRKEKFDDPSIWEKARELLANDPVQHSSDR